MKKDYFRVAVKSISWEGSTRQDTCTFCASIIQNTEENATSRQRARRCTEMYRSRAAAMLGRYSRRDSISFHPWSRVLSRHSRIHVRGESGLDLRRARLSDATEPGYCEPHILLFPPLLDPDFLDGPHLVMIQ